MSQLHETHHSTVTADQIDHLGHMNVHYYGVNALQATGAFLERCAPDGDPGLRVTDVYTRHHREQLLGAELFVRTGVLDAGERGLRLYHELVERSSEVLAASFVHTLQLDTGATLPAAIAEAAAAWKAPMPEAGAPRTIGLDVDPMAAVPELETVRSRRLEMRTPRPIGADECDASGMVRWSNAPGLVWGGTPTNGSVGPELHEGPDGERMGWASMETRMSVRRLPSLGDRIQSFGVVVGLGDKVSHRVHWAYDVDRGDVLVVFEVVSLAFDTVGRRAMSIPDHVRAGEERFLQPDLAPEHARVIS